jgi:hypothetical protein
LRCHDPSTATAQPSRSISRKAAKHALSKIEGGAKKKTIPNFAFLAQQSDLALIGLRLSLGASKRISVFGLENLRQRRRLPSIVM